MRVLGSSDHKSEIWKMETIVVGISLNATRSAELLSWAISVAATPGDTVRVVHVAVKEERKLGDFVQTFKTRIERANAFTVDLLGAFTDLCQAKQVKAEAKVLVAPSIEKGLIDEVVALGASFLILGDFSYHAKRSTLGVMNYCLQHAPPECSVIVLKSERLTHQPENFPTIPVNSDSSHEGLHRLSLKWPGKDVAKTLMSFQKRLISKISSGNEEMVIEMDNGYNAFHQSKEKHLSIFRTFEDVKIESSHSVSKSCLFGHRSLAADEVDCRYNQQTCFSVLRNFNLAFPTLFPSSLSRRPTHCIAKSDAGKDRNNTNGNEPAPLTKPSWRCFTFEEIVKATNNFHPDSLVGKGGYAEVYRGELEDGRIVAVKKLANANTDEEKERDFLTELGVIGHVCHPNTASLIGCCIENGLHLIFPFSPHGSLASILHGTNNQSPSWPIRYKIAVGTARGLHYLHKCCKRRIIHRDIKASNVLLGEDFEPQISDFGLAKWLPKQWSHHSITPVEGTFGYLAPEYFLHGIVDEKTDVYSFGVLLLEIISGRKPSDVSEQNILLWAKPLLDSGNISELADPRLLGRYDTHQMQRVVLTASLCVRESAIWRPSMNEVLQLLTDSQGPAVLEDWSMRDFKKSGINDYSESDESEYKHGTKCVSPTS